jgi:hypothetical protein
MCVCMLWRYGLSFFALEFFGLFIPFSLIPLLSAILSKSQREVSRNIFRCVFTPGVNPTNLLISSFYPIFVVKLECF